MRLNRLGSIANSTQHLHIRFSEMWAIGMPFWRVLLMIVGFPCPTLLCRLLLWLSVHANRFRKFISLQTTAVNCTGCTRTISWTLDQSLENCVCFWHKLTCSGRALAGANYLTAICSWFLGKENRYVCWATHSVIFSSIGFRSTILALLIWKR